MDELFALISLACIKHIGLVLNTCKTIDASISLCVLELNSI